jgi:hypothetical protein
LARQTLSSFPQTVHVADALIIECFFDDGRNLMPHPFAFGFEFHPSGLVIGGASVIDAMLADSGGVADVPLNRRVTPRASGAGAKAAFVQEPRNRPTALVLLVEFIDQLADGCLGLINDKFLVYPTVTVGSSSTEGFSKFGSDRNGCGNARCNLLAFPVRHRR